MPSADWVKCESLAQAKVLGATLEASQNGLRAAKNSQKPHYALLPQSWHPRGSEELARN